MRSRHNIDRFKSWFGITRDIDMRVWYDRQSRSWWAAYYEASETPAGTPVRWQVGDAWFGPSREYVMIHRPALNTTEV